MTRLILILLTLICSEISAQTNINKCITTKLVEQELKDNQDYFDAFIKRKKEHERLSGINTHKTTITIPIVVHVVHRDIHVNIGTNTNIPDIQIEDAIRILNEDYSKTNSEFPNPPRTTFLNDAGDADLQFCLATSDPDGNPTSGIVRKATTKQNFDADDDDTSDPCHEANAMKRTSCGGSDSWDPSRYLNIWVCDLTNSSGQGMTLGYAYLPGLLAGWGQSAWKDGLVIDYRFFGTTGNAASSFQNDGRTATHEIGHYLGLNHTFCETGSCCDNDSWNVDDTPATYYANNGGPYFGFVNSNTNNNTCNDLNYGFNTDLLDMDENYMSYSRNTWMFSNGQVSAMLNVLNTQDSWGGRATLKNTVNNGDVNVNCSGTVNTIEYVIPNFSVFPNPSQGTFHIKTDSKIKSIFVSNILGSIVYTNPIKNHSESLININHLENGIYYLTIKSEAGINTRKIILSK